MKVMARCVLGLAIASSLSSCAANFASTPASDPMAPSSGPRASTFVAGDQIAHSFDGATSDSLEFAPVAATMIDVRKPDLGRELAAGVGEALARKLLYCVPLVVALALSGTGN